MQLSSIYGTIDCVCFVGYVLLVVSSSFGMSGDLGIKSPSFQTVNSHSQETHNVMLTLNPVSVAPGGQSTSCSPQPMCMWKGMGLGLWAPVMPKTRASPSLPRKSYSPSLWHLQGQTEMGGGIWKGLRPPSPQIMLF